MITNITSGVILKGSDVEFIVVLTNKCDWDVFNNTTLNFYTTGSTSIEYPIGDTTSITQTVHLQGVELEALGDGVLRYTSTYQDGDGDAHTVEMQTQFYLKTPIDYTPIDFASTEYVDEAIAEAVISGVTYSAGTNIDISDRIISVTGIDTSHFVTSADVKTQVEAYDYATESQIPDVSEFVTSADVKTQVEAYNYVNSGDVKTQVEAYNYVTSGDVKTQVESYGYATESQIPDVSNFVTSGDVKTQVEAYNYATTGYVQDAISGITGGTTYTAGDNINISAQNVIEVTGITSYTGINSSDVTTALGYTPLSAVPDTYATTTDVANAVSGKQDTIVAGNNIAINSNTVSVTGITSYPGYDAISGDIATQIEGYGYTTSGDVNNQITAATSGLQETLVSGTNIKTVNSSSVLGSGNLEVGDVRGNGITGLRTGTQAQYDALASKSNTIVYLIHE